MFINFGRVTVLQRQWLSTFLDRAKSCTLIRTLCMTFTVDHVSALNLSFKNNKQMSQWLCVRLGSFLGHILQYIHLGICDYEQNATQVAHKRACHKMISVPIIEVFSLHIANYPRLATFSLYSEFVLALAAEFKYGETLLTSVLQGAAPPTLAVERDKKNT